MRVDQHPVAGWLAFDAHLAQAGFLEGFDEMIGDGADVPLRAAGCDHHIVSDGGFAAQVDGDDVFRLIIIQTSDNQGEDFLSVNLRCGNLSGRQGWGGR